jgi:hypothetical protein
VKASAAALSAIFALLLAEPASAHQGYPQRVDAAFGVSVETIDPSMGCQLCHTSGSGGTTSLRPFGQHLVATYGLDNSATENDQSLDQALQGLKAGDPQLVADLQKGLDPNPDVLNDPTPQYGCAVGPRGGGFPCGALVALAVAGVLARRLSSTTSAERRSIRRRPRPRHGSPRPALSSRRSDGNA